jgi:hypothetical protein
MSFCLRAKNWIPFDNLTAACAAGTIDKISPVEFSVDRGSLIVWDFSLHGRLRLVPKGCGDDQGIDPLALPPGALVAAPVELTMVQPANGNGKPVADFPPHRPLLCKFDVVGGGHPTVFGRRRDRAESPQTSGVRGYAHAPVC